MVTLRVEYSLQSPAPWNAPAGVGRIASDFRPYCPRDGDQNVRASRSMICLLAGRCRPRRADSAPYRFIGIDSSLMPLSGLYFLPKES